MFDRLGKTSQKPERGVASTPLVRPSVKKLLFSNIELDMKRVAQPA